MTMHFDGSRCKKGSGVGVIFFTPQKVPIPYSFKLNFSYRKIMRIMKP